MLVLVLTRKSSQSIMIGDDIEVTVLSSYGAKVRLGIQAPQAIPVHRTEVYDQIRAKHQESASREQRDPSRAHGGRAGSR
jgi:carbon storage regulator